MRIGNYNNGQSGPPTTAKVCKSKANSAEKKASTDRREPKATSEDGKFYTLTDVAKLLLVSDRTVGRWVECKKLVTHRFGGATRISTIEFNSFIMRARRGGTPPQPRNSIDKDFYTVEMVAEILNVCSRTVRRHIKSGALTVYRFGRVVRVADSDLHDFIDGSRRD